MNFQDFNTLLREDVVQIQMVASRQETELAQIQRIQNILMAAAFCLTNRMGHLATAHWLHQVAERYEAEGKRNVQ